MWNKLYIGIVITLFYGCSPPIRIVPIPGPSGAPGTPCTVSKVDGVSTISCPDGTSSAIQDGLAGSIGPQGIVGPAGQPASQVTVVQFCPGYTTSYPSVFPEFGFLINGKIYATYWDGKNAWTAQVVPGYYQSTSTTAPCNFTVNSDGSIS